MASDRSRSQVLWLDEDLIVNEVWRVEHPVALAWSGGRLWLASAGGLGGSGGHRVLCLARDGRLVGSWHTGPVLGMVPLGDSGGVLLLGEDQAGQAVLWQGDGKGRWLGPREVPGAKRLLVADTGVWVLGGLDWLAWLPELVGSELLEFEVPEILQTVAGARVHGDWLWCRGSARSSAWQALNPDRGRWGLPRMRPWLPQVLMEQWPKRITERKPPALGAWLGAQELIPGAEGSWLMRGPEFLWRLGPLGEPLVGQGGFGYLTGVARVLP